MPPRVQLKWACERNSTRRQGDDTGSVGCTQGTLLDPNPRVGGCLCRPTKGAGRARPVNRGGGGWGEVAEYCKIFHPLGGKIAGFFPLCAKFPSLRPPPRPCCSNWIPSRLKKP